MQDNANTTLAELAREWIARWETHGDNVDLPHPTVAALRAKLATIVATPATTIEGISAKARVLVCLDCNHDGLTRSLCADLV